MNDDVSENLALSFKKKVKLSLESDLVSYNELLFSANGSTYNVEFTPLIESVIFELLTSGVEIGQAFATEKYVKFVGWKGDINQRIKRARAIVESHSTEDCRWAIWLCLTKNVDEYETT
jgi:hypothetical protein